MAPSEDFRLLLRSSPVFSGRFLYHEQYVVAISLFFPIQLIKFGKFFHAELWQPETLR